MVILIFIAGGLSVERACSAYTSIIYTCTGFTHTNQRSTLISLIHIHEGLMRYVTEVTSSQAFHVCHAVFFPLVLKNDTVSQPV